MESYEDKIQAHKEQIKHLDYSLLKFLWEVGPLTAQGKGVIPKFLRKINVFKNFTENELRILSGFMHQRQFSQDEVIFKQNSQGIGFYLILSGAVEIVASGTEVKTNDQVVVTNLDKYDYFGELAMLHDDGVRTASAVSRGNTVLLGILRPDLHELIEKHPVVAAKLLQSLALILANRLISTTGEMKVLKQKLKALES